MSPDRIGSGDPEPARREPADSPLVGPGDGVLLETIIPYLVNRLSFQMNRLLNKDLRRHGLQITHWRVLAVLDSASQSSINDLSAYAMIEQPTVSRLVARMEEDGLVRRERTGSDGRIVMVSMTAKGRELYEQVRGLALAHADRALIGISDGDKARLSRTILQMVDNLQKFPIALKPK